MESYLNSYTKTSGHRDVCRDHRRMTSHPPQHRVRCKDLIRQAHRQRHAGAHHRFRPGASTGAVSPRRTNLSLPIILTKSSSPRPLKLLILSSACLRLPRSGRCWSFPGRKSNLTGQKGLYAGTIPPGDVPRFISCRGGRLNGRMFG